jgi:hypothetical protein
VKLLEEAISLVDKYIGDVDAYCGKQFNWDEYKKNMKFPRVEELLLEEK